MSSPEEFAFDIMIFPVSQQLKTRARMTTISGGSNVRTRVTEGMIERLPLMGERFRMFSEPIVVGCTGRYVMTSPVVLIEDVCPGSTRITTESGSVYLIEILEEEDV